MPARGRSAYGVVSFALRRAAGVARIGFCVMVHAWAHARGRMVAACELDAPPAGFARAVSPAPGGRDTASALQHSGRALDLERMALVMCGFLLGAGAGRPASSLSMPWQAESSGARATAVELYVGKKPCWLGVSVQENDGLSLLPPLPFPCLFFYFFVSLLPLCLSPFPNANLLLLCARS